MIFYAFSREGEDLTRSKYFSNGGVNFYRNP